MAIAQRPQTGSVALRRERLTGVRFPTAAITHSVAAVGRWFVGAGQGPRAHRREGYPEHELYQIIAGRQDRFRGL